jgi:F-type H+-transporting ATPase subunit c
MESQTQITLAIIITSGVGILASTITLAIVEGRAVLKALEGMTRQPEVANRLFTSLIVGMALLETSAIYVILVISLLLGFVGG